MNKILGITFYNDSVKNLIEILNINGGLLTVPAAPALVNIPKDKHYYACLLNSDIVIADSGYMVLIWNTFFSRNKLKKISGFKFISYFIENPNEIKGEVFTINPSDEEGKINTSFLTSKGINATNSHTAPFYNGNIEDESLLQKLESLKPSWILINIGGGTQEKLGLYLKNQLSYKPAIICTGAAIAFKTGRQVKMKNWMDVLYLGWLARCISKPKIFVPRYMSAFKLFSLIFKYKKTRVNF